MTKNAAQRTFRNPVLPGFTPDPSVCRVGDDYYLATSSFAYFPGIPIHHSRDLVHWRLVGHVLDRPSQLPLDGCGHSQGIFAPAIRHRDGVFYVTCTNVSDKGNFYCTAVDPAGPWSEPNWLPDAPGIDPTIFFDDDGRSWYLGTRPAPEGPKYNGNWEVWLQEIDLERKRLKGPSHGLWRGALRDAVWPEGPHLYRVDGWYYLLIAEAGTEADHAVSIARSRELTGPYEGCRRNPILTNRHLGRDCPVVNVGHADLVQIPNGDWWMVLLASRPYGGYYRNLGRETFLCPVAWEDGWPLPSPGSGALELEYPAPALPERRFHAAPACDHFDAPRPALGWKELRNPEPGAWDLARRPGWLGLRLRPPRITDRSNPSCLLRSQTSMDFAARCLMEFEPRAEGECAGMVIMQNEDFLFRLELGRDADGPLLRALRRSEGNDELLGTARPAGAGRLHLKIEAAGQDFRFDYALEPEAWIAVAEGADGRILSTDRAGGFVGACVGLYASAGGRDSDNVAEFDYFELREL